MSEYNIKTNSMSKRYNLAYNYIFEQQAMWKKELIIKGEGDSYDRVWGQFIKDTLRLAESDRDIPIVKSNYKELKLQICPSGC